MPDRVGDIVRSHLRNGDMGLARVAAEQLLQSPLSDDDAGRVYGMLSRAWVRLGRPEEAMKAAEAASQRTHHWWASLALGQAMVATGEPMAGRAILAEAHRALKLRGDQGQPREDTIDAEILVGTALAESCRAAGDPETGVGVATRALAWAERYHGEDAPEAADARFALGICLYGAAQMDEAFRALDRTLTIRRNWRDGSAEVAATLDALGSVQRKRGKPFEAVAHHREALAIWEANLGPHTSPVGACRHSLAQALHRTGDFIAAREEMARALLITARTLGDDHVDTWITRFELGRYQVDTGQMEEGFRTMEEARKVVANRLGRFHPVVKAMDRYL